MKTITIAVLFAVLAAAQPFAEQATPDEKAARLRNANRKVTLGLALIGVGALTAPLTAMARRNGDAGGPAMNTGIALMFVGGGIAWWGATERRRALQPQTGISVGVGRSFSLHAHRLW